MGNSQNIDANPALGYLRKGEEDEKSNRIGFDSIRNFFSNLLRFQWHCSSQNHSRGRKNLHGQSTGDGRNSRPGYENPAHSLAIHPLQSLERLLYALSGSNKILPKGG